VIKWELLFENPAWARFSVEGPGSGGTKSRGTFLGQASAAEQKEKTQPGLVVCGGVGWGVRGEDQIQFGPIFVI
jgi:hypothetical protein